VKKRLILGVLLSLMLVAGLVAGAFSPVLAAAGSTSVTITKYDTDGTTVLAQTTVAWDWMAANLPPQGDGVTHYYYQGPVQTGDMWDPGETENLEDFGPCMGTDVKDLCELPEVGGAPEGSEIQFRCSVDGFNQYFARDDVYNPEPEQGKIVLTWLNADYGDVSDGYDKGMRNVFFTDDGVFGNWDMHQTLAEKYWHYWTTFPSSKGLSVQNIDQINIYLAPPQQWELQLHGYLDYTVTQAYFEEGVAHHGAVSYTDSKGRVWSGMPLWLLCGYVDDANMHDEGAFNDDLAAAGYDVIVSDAADPPYAKTLPSSRVARNDDIIVANCLNGAPIPADDSSYPLRLVGTGLVSGSERVKAIASITLVNLPTLMEFNVDHMYINFTWLRPRTQDTIIANGSFSLPEGVSCDLASDDVSMAIDGVNLMIPAGSFKKWLPRREIYTYSASFKDSPSIWMSLNFGTGEWSLLVRDVDASVVDNSDGVDVKLSLGSIVGIESIGMRIDSLSY
jgi:hypothetical protein